MSQTRKRQRLCDKTNGKCGEITFCLQVGKRVYALNCSFCCQIFIQWDGFINHMEKEHDDELRSDHLLQQENEEVNVDVNNSKETVTMQLFQELPQTSRISVRPEFNENTLAKAAVFGYDHALMENEDVKHSEAENVHSYESQIINAAKLDIDEQKTFDSMQSLSETDSDMEATTAQANSTFYKLDNMSPVISNISCVGADAEFISLNADNSMFNRSFWQPLPSTQDIRQIPDFRNILKIDVLENKHRTRLAKALINFILSKQPERKMFKEDFLQLAQAIVELFPSEVIETYYVPYKSGHTPKGKLFDAYNNTRTRLRVAGLIRTRVKAKPEENNASENGNDCENESTEDIDESELNILQSGCSDWNLVLEKWRKTHYYRRRELKNLNLKPQEYIEKYKVILHTNNYELFDMDFKMLYPTAKNFNEWKLYYQQIIVKADKLKDRSVRDILAYIEDTEDEDSKLALSIMLIAYILPNPRKRTKLEIQECFISYCKNISLADEDTKHRIKRVKHEGHPKIYLIGGDSRKPISEAFVDICGTRLRFENPIKAIEVCFYCFMVMNIKYPKYGAHVWIFIQKLIYEVNTPWDTVIPAINTLINDLRLEKVQQ